MSGCGRNDQNMDTKKRRKRGRPKKIDDAMQDQSRSENEIILELPISMNDLEKYCVGSGKDLPEMKKKNTQTRPLKF